MIRNLIYISKVTQELSKIEIKELLFKARIKNRENQITGFLICKEGYFIQWIEGPSQNIENLLADLLNDKRHHSLKVVLDRVLETPIFDNWRMLYLPELLNFEKCDFEHVYNSNGDGDILECINLIEFDSLSQFKEFREYNDIAV